MVKVSILRVLILSSLGLAVSLLSLPFAMAGGCWSSKPKLETDTVASNTVAAPPIEECSRNDSLQIFREAMPGIPPVLLEIIESYLHLNLHPENKKISALYKKAMAGDMDAAYNLGIFYSSYGKLGIRGNDKESVFWYELAIKQNQPYAKNNLGVHYLFGAAVQQDFRKAYTLFVEATAQSSGFAQANQGAMYLSGLWVSKDTQKAFELLSGTSREPNKWAQVYLGLFAEKGISPVIRDLSNARDRYILCADDPIAGSPANIGLGVLSAKGVGVDQDASNALLYFKRAIEADPTLTKKNFKEYLRVYGRSDDAEDPIITALFERAFELKLLLPWAY